MRSIGEECAGGIPLRVIARLSGGVCLPDGFVALDSLLASAVAQREGLDPPAHSESEDFVRIEIPIRREPGGRFHLASFSIGDSECFEVDWTNRRFPIDEAQALGGERLRRVSLSAGPGKSYRLPRERKHLVDDRLVWFCVGDPDAIRDLLSWVHYVGKKRSVGLGRVAEWSVEPIEPWGDGFPVAMDGRALRTLPSDWSGLRDPEIGYRIMSYPYWAHHRAELCAVVS